MGLSSRTVLRFGYAAVIALLVFSTVEAYRIQNIVSERHIDIYRQHIKQDEAISRLRRNIWLAGSYVRDFFLSSNPDRAAVLKSQFQELDLEIRQALAQLAQLKPDEATGRLAAHVREYWDKLEPIPESMGAVEASAAYRFIQEEVVPGRSALYNELQRMKQADQEALQQNELRFVDTRQEAVRRLLFLLALCVVLGILVAHFSLRHSDRLERETAARYEEIARAKREMEQLSARLLEIEEDGRRRLSRELHDEIGQTLAVLEIEVSHAQALAGENQRRLRERLERARELAEKTVQTVRHIALLLRPALLDDLGLVPALQWLLEDFQRRSGVASEFSEEDVQDLLPDSVKTCVYRVVQEALHNCEKHAAASQVRVNLRQHPNRIRVEIEDNGCGLEVNEKGMPRRNAGLGILGMRERAARLGGALTLESAPGKGVQIRLEIPITALAAAAGAAAPSETKVAV